MRRSLATACGVGVLALVAAFTAPLAAAARPQPFTATYTLTSWTETGEQTVGTLTHIEYGDTYTYTLTSAGTTYAGTATGTGRILLNSNGDGPFEETDVISGGSPCGSGAYTNQGYGTFTDFVNAISTTATGVIVSAPSPTDTVHIHLVGTFNSPPGNYVYQTGVLSCN